MQFLKRLSLLALSVMTFVSCDAQLPEKSALIKGVSFVATRDSITPIVVQPFKDYNANYVAVHPYGFMRDVENPAVRYNDERQWWGERLAGTKHTIDIFHQNGFQVMLKPQIWIGRGVYTGTIEMPDEARWDTLAVTYENFILDHARVAQETSAELFCIGTELESFVAARPDYWMELIKKIRAIYKGKLTYAGNWDSYKNEPFWDLLDFIGVDAYFPLSDQKTPDLATTKAGWEQWMVEMSSLSRKHNKQILFAEYGYTSADYAGREPWQSADETKETNELAQANLLQAQYELIWQQEWFAGGFLWKHHSEQGRRGFEKLFTPQGKLAEKTVSDAYLKL